jgi:uncharacterized protein HemX
MSNKAKVPVLLIIMILVVVLALGAAGLMFVSLQSETVKNNALQEELKSNKETQKMLENKIDESRKTVQGLEAKLKDNLAQIESLSKGIQQERSQKEEALSQLQNLRADLEQQQSLRSDLETRFTTAQEQLKSLRDQLGAMEGRKAELEVKLKELEEKSQGVELGTIVVAPEEAAPAGIKTEPAKKEAPKKAAKPAKKQKEEAPAAGGMEGNVLVVNKDYNFAVISLGSKDGVNIGDTFAIYHNNKYLGDAKIEKIHESMAAAGFVSEAMKNKVSEGDKVIRKGK